MTDRKISRCTTARQRIGRMLDALGIEAGSKQSLEWVCGPYDSAGRWLQRRKRIGTHAMMLADVPELIRLNDAGWSVFLRAPSGMIYLDDVTPAGADALRNLGVVPRAVVETSPGRLQVWLRVPDEVDVHTLYVAIESRIGADPGARPSAKGAGRLGRLPGFRNTKPSRSGCWVLLRSATRRMESGSSIAVLHELAEHQDQKNHTAARAARAAPMAMKPPSGRRASSPPATVDESRADWAAACRAAGAPGATQASVRAAILRRRPYDQIAARHDAEDYLRRTVTRAMAHVSDGRGQAVPLNSQAARPA
jgi:hypothetical protein